MTREEKVLQLKQDFDEVFEAGKQAEYDAFWDVYQNSGNRNSYAYGFYGWNAEIFLPKYDIKPTNMNYMFVGFIAEEPMDLTQRLEDRGIVLDTSLATGMSYAFYCKGFKRLPKIDTRSTDELFCTFASTEALITIEELVLRDDGSQTFRDAFSWGNNKLTNLTMTGTIGQNGLNFQWSTKLSKASIESIIDCLDLTEDRPATTITLSLIAVNKAFETSEGTNDGANSNEWNDLCASARVANWTISCV